LGALTEHLERRLVFGGVSAADRDDVIRAVVDCVVEAGGLDRRKASFVLRFVKERERVGTTGIGRGIALPHCKTNVVDRPLVAFARLSAAVDYGATDGEPVHSVFLIASPPESADLHVAILRTVAKLARDDYYARILRNTTDPGSLFELFREADGKA
jgi:mannitol/fructose-specific phosphotransferase system IIA component (Ntr-type)